MSMTQGQNAIWSDINSILTRVNSARTKHGLAKISLTQTEKIDKNNINTLVTSLIQANNAITSSTVSMTGISTVNSGDIIKAQTVSNIYNKAYEVYNHCTCVSKCSCNCDYCSCDCDYCSCECDYGCTCDCNYKCSCDCNYTCTCDCNYGCTCQCYQCPDGGCGCVGESSGCKNYSCSKDQT